MPLAFAMIKRLFEEKSISIEDSKEVTYDDLVLYSRVMELLKADPELTDEQLGRCYDAMRNGAVISCTKSGIDIQSRFGGSLEHISDQFLQAAEIKQLIISRYKYEKSYVRNNDDHSYDGTGSNNNNNNNNNNNA